MKLTKFQRKHPLDNNKWYCAPVRRRRALDSLKDLQLENLKIYGEQGYFFKDRTYITADETGRLKSSGGQATKAYFKHQMWNIGRNGCAKKQSKELVSHDG